ncbi:ankyrin [Decorospora gaudefroyi]|uniref:Ankyrin n=1 Tax=Decorospora gaudefroyi TaxID=184978 RepID=A0A6A5KVY2_9PLEO|nr:ankyrin [Decorospora gaudefroyi]
MPVCPLFCAASSGLSTVTRLLLDKGADVIAKSGYFGYLLQAASDAGHEQLVKILPCYKGAWVDAPSIPYDYNSFKPPLYLASSRVHEQVIKPLFDKDAQVEDALSAASEADREEMLKALFDQGTHVGLALSKASERGHEQIVKMLLDKGAQIGGALSAAFEGRHEQVVKILLEQIDKNYNGPKIPNSFPESYVVQRLLGEGLRLNAQRVFYYNQSLSEASKADHQQVVKILLDKCADITAQSGCYDALYYGDALHAASMKGRTQVVKILLDKGAENSNAFSAASARYHKQVNTKVKNALRVASYRGYEQVVKILLDYGADVHGEGDAWSVLGYGRDYGGLDTQAGTALYCASDGAKKEIVKMLLDKGADVNAQNSNRANGCNALCVALERHHHEVVRMLLDNGAKLNVCEGHRPYALLGALAGGHEQVAKALLDLGVKPRPRTYEHWP